MRDLAAAVGRRALARDEAAALQPGEEPAEVAGVDPHPAAQVDDVEPLVLGQLEQHARLAERVRRVEVARLEQPELPR